MKFANHLIKSKKGDLNSEEVANGKGATEEKLQSGMPEYQERAISLTEKQAGTPETSH